MTNTCEERSSSISHGEILWPALHNKKDKTLRCYACDCQLDNPQPDPKTDRFYCNECFSFTDEVIFYNQQKDLEKFLGNFSVSAPEIDEVLDTETLPEYNEYQSLDDSDE